MYLRNLTKIKTYVVLLAAGMLLAVMMTGCGVWDELLRVSYEIPEETMQEAENPVQTDKEEFAAEAASGPVISEILPEDEEEPEEVREIAQTGEAEELPPDEEAGMETEEETEADGEEEIEVTTQESGNDAEYVAFSDLKAWAEDPSTGLYYGYDVISEEYRTVYIDILETLLYGREETQLGTLSKDAVSTVFYCVLMDHPELFYVTGYVHMITTMDDVPVKLEFSGSYSMSLQEAESLQKQVDEEVERILSGMEDGMSTYEKEKYLFDYIVLNTDYSMAAENNQNYLSVFLNQVSVCQGYSRAFQYLLQRCGIPCTLVTGTADGESHAWNLVKADGKYYYVDVTWGDACFRDGQASGAYADFVNYTYFNSTTAQILTEHTIDEKVPFPECTSVSLNYFVKEGLYLENFDAQRIDAILKDCYESSESRTIRCADASVYNELYDYMITQAHLTTYATPGERVYYLDNPTALCFTILL